MINEEDLGSPATGPARGFGKPDSSQFEIFLPKVPVLCTQTEGAETPPSPASEPPLDATETFAESGYGPDDRIVNSTELGHWLGLETRGIYDAEHRGWLAKTPGQGWWLKRSIRNYCDMMRERTRGRKANGGNARDRLLNEQADYAAMKNQRERGELVRADEVAMVWAGELALIRSAMLALPSRISVRLSHLSRHDIAEIRQEVILALREEAERGISDRHGDDGAETSSAAG